MIVFPMAGLSRRFQVAGYTLPKFMLPLKGRPLFDHCVDGFSALFDSEPFLFIHGGGPETEAFVRERCRVLGLAEQAVHCVGLDKPTGGQAETVAVGLRSNGFDPSAPLTVFNIDTIRRGFRYPTAFDRSAVDGYLEVFEGSGDNWSFVRDAGDGRQRAAEVTEKQPISNLCSTGLYDFARAKLFMDAYQGIEAVDPALLPGRERYVAPLYNTLISAGCDIRYDVIDRSEVVFCGTPDEYEQLTDEGRAFKTPQPLT